MKKESGGLGLSLGCETGGEVVDKQIPEQAKAFSISEEEVVEMVMLKETVDGAFTTVADVSETALFLAS